MLKGSDVVFWRERGVVELKRPSPTCSSTGSVELPQPRSELQHNSPSWKMGKTAYNFKPLQLRHQPSYICSKLKVECSCYKQLQHSVFSVKKLIKPCNNWALCHTEWKQTNAGWKRVWVWSVVKLFVNVIEGLGMLRLLKFRLPGLIYKHSQLCPTYLLHLINNAPKTWTFLLKARTLQVFKILTLNPKQIKSLNKPSLTQFAPSTKILTHNILRMLRSSLGEFLQTYVYFVMIRII